MFLGRLGNYRLIVPCRGKTKAVGGLEKIRVEMMKKPELKRDGHNNAFSPGSESLLLVTTDPSLNHALDSGHRWGILLLTTDARCDSSRSLARWYCADA